MLHEDSPAAPLSLDEPDPGHDTVENRRAHDGAASVSRPAAWAHIARSPVTSGCFKPRVRHFQAPSHSTPRAKNGYHCAGDESRRRKWACRLDRSATDQGQDCADPAMVLLRAVGTDRRRTSPAPRGIGSHTEPTDPSRNQAASVRRFRGGPFLTTAICPRCPHACSNKSSHRLQPSHRALHRFYLSRCRLILSVTAHPIKGGALFHDHLIVGDVTSNV